MLLLFMLGSSFGFRARGRSVAVIRFDFIPVKGPATPPTPR